MSPKANPKAGQIAALKALAFESPSVPGMELIRKGLGSSSNRVAAAAAGAAAAWNAETLEGDLVAMFRQFMADAIKSDPGCGAKVSAIEALLAIQSMEFPVYLEGLHHVQMEPVFGTREDTGPRLRIASGRALAALGYPDIHAELAVLLTDSETEARQAAATILASLPGESSELLLRMRVLTNDPDPGVMDGCFSALMALDPHRSLPFVAGYLDADLPVAQGAALALGESHLDEAFDALASAWGDTIEAERRQAFALPIALLRTDAAVAFLRRAIRDENTWTAMAALDALGQIAGDEAQRREICAAIKGRHEGEFRRALDRWDS